MIPDKLFQTCRTLPDCDYCKYQLICRYEDAVKKMNRDVLYMVSNIFNVRVTCNAFEDKEV